MSRELPSSTLEELDYMDVLIYSDAYTNSTENPYTFTVPLDPVINDVVEVELLDRHIPVQTVTKIKVANWGLYTTDVLGDDVTTEAWTDTPVLPAYISIQSTTVDAVITAWDPPYTEAGVVWRILYITQMEPQLTDHAGWNPGIVHASVMYIRFISGGAETSVRIDGFFMVSTVSSPVELRVSLGTDTIYKQLRTVDISDDTFWVFTPSDLNELTSTRLVRRQLRYKVANAREITITYEDRGDPYQVPSEINVSTVPFTFLYTGSFLYLRLWFISATNPYL